MHWYFLLVGSLPFHWRRAWALPDASNFRQTQLTPPLFEASESDETMSACPGYTLEGLKELRGGVVAQLVLNGSPCNSFGHDIANLTLEVKYETATRLHVKISDTADQQYTIPDTVFQRPEPSPDLDPDVADLKFNYQPSPFAFWITRRSDPQAEPLFDTRLSSLPVAPTEATVSGNTVPLDDFNLKFQDQYLEITSALPLGTNIYGLGEAVASSGFRRAVGDDGGTLQTMWARDAADPVDENVYGSHPVYLEHRFSPGTNSSQSHGVFLLSAAGSDILLLTPKNSNTSLVQYRATGGILDFYFLSGPTPKKVIEQYGQVVGLPTWQPVWGFGFHLCRWGYQNLNETRDQVIKMREANIPLEVMWNDIDLYHALRDFTTDPVSFPGEDVRAFIKELAQNNQHYIPIVDAAIAKQVNNSDIVRIYSPTAKNNPHGLFTSFSTTPTQRVNVFITNPDGSEYVGQVWPGFTVFPDWFQEAAQDWWTDALKNWTRAGVEFSGIWLDMNEASSFCDGSCGTNADLSNTSPPFVLPGHPGNPILDYPECYNSSIFGPSGNMTVNGQTTCQDPGSQQQLLKRGLGAGHQQGVDLNSPPYAIHNGCFKGFGRLSIHTLATNATHVDGQVELDVHNLWGLMEEKATHAAVREVLPGKRPFLISRSTFASSGKWTGHWLGDNFSLWSYLRFSIAGVLQFQLFQIPFVGADTCGFNGNTDEELCNRWMELSAFHPFYRNHNIQGAISQEPYRWDSVANASRNAINVRYRLLPYWYTLFANASLYGTPPVRALFFEFPDEPELFAVDSQFLIGRDILVTPVLQPNVSTVDGLFPGHGKVIWRDWYTHEKVVANPGQSTTLSAPLDHINVHVRDGSALLLHKTPAYTITETREGPYSLLLSLSSDLQAFGTAYIDDGDSYPPGPHRIVTFISASRELRLSTEGAFNVTQKLQEVIVLGVPTSPSSVTIDGKAVEDWSYRDDLEKLVLSVDIDLNREFTLRWN